MKTYYCNICQEDHVELEESDMHQRIHECDTDGHVGKCVTTERDGTYWCAYCARSITKEQHDKAREALDK
jgi:DNA-directed RNA polymerase subunit RPC12/RpoP